MLLYSAFYYTKQPLRIKQVRAWQVGEGNDRSCQMEGETVCVYV